MTNDSSSRALPTTLAKTVRRDAPNALGYRTLSYGPGEDHHLRLDLGGTAPAELQSLVCFLHLSDLHVTDVQSPARAEFLDRHGDEDSPYAQELGRVGLYRAQEALTAQVLEAMTTAANQIEHGPLTGAPCSFALSTGDATDNCQENELATYISVLDGGHDVSTDSGDIGRFEGVGALDFYDERYWHPDGQPDGEQPDIPHRRHGFPTVPGLLDGAIAPFATNGLAVPWYAVYGNHDALFGGTLYPHGILGNVAVGNMKVIGLEESVDPRSLLANNETEPSIEHWRLFNSPVRTVTPDAARRPVTNDEWIARHLASQKDAIGHGLSLAAKGRCYYAFDAGLVRVLVLDTVNQEGGWQGSIDDEQFHWLENELVQASATYFDENDHPVTHDTEDRLIVLVSHHPIETLINGFSSSLAIRHLEEDVRKLLGRFPNVVCWVNGHTHCNTVQPVVPSAKHHAGFWQVTTASHIDWPQQSRIIEIALDANGDVVIGCTMLDHLGAIAPSRDMLNDPLEIAGWSRELSANAWQGLIDDEPMGRGQLRDRNVILVKPAPFGGK